MDTPAERIAALVRGWSPFTYCFACLAATLEMPEHAARDAALTVLVRPEYDVIRRVCYTCRRMSDVLAFSGPPDED